MQAASAQSITVIACFLLLCWLARVEIKDGAHVFGLRFQRPAATSQFSHERAQLEIIAVSCVSVAPARVKS